MNINGIDVTRSNLWPQLIWVSDLDGEAIELSATQARAVAAELIRLADEIEHKEPQP